MRVAIDARLVTYQPAGIGNYVLSLLSALHGLIDPRDVEVLISRKDRTIADRVAPFRVRPLWTPPHNRFEQVALAAEIAPIKADVYHAPDFVPPLLRRFPAVITVHDLAFVRMPELLTPESRRYYSQIGRAVRSAERIIAVSECTRRDAIELVGAPAARIDVVYEAADACFRPLEPNELEARPSDLPDEFLLFVGTLEPRKNLPTLINAYAELVTRSGNTPPRVGAGRRGWLAADLETRAGALGVGERIIWLGGVDRRELVELYNRATALVLPSLYEGFGLTVLEAMACGTPVVASTGGSLPEIVGDAGLLVDSNDQAGLMAALERVCREPDLRAELRQRGLARARQFSWRTAAEQTLDVYRRAA